MRIAHGTSSCTCAGAVRSQLLYAGENFPIVCRLIPGTWCAGLTAALSGLECPEDWGRPTCAGHFRFLVSFRRKPNCGDQAPILCMSAYSQKLAYAFAYQSGRQRSERWNCLRRQAQHGWQRSFTAVCRCFQTEQKHPRISVSGGVFIGDCEKLSWYRCSWSQAGCCRHR